MPEMDAVYWDSSYNSILLANLAIAIGIFASVRFLAGVISHVNAIKELAVKDNPAFGISLAGVVFAVTIVLTGAIYGDPIFTLEDSVIAVGMYGVLGVLLMIVTRVIFDKISLPNISIGDEILKGNVSAAIVDAGNVIATAIVIRTMMVWVQAKTVEGLTAVLTGYAISQFLLTGTTYLRTLWFRHHKGKTYQEAFTSGNTAVALRFAGRKIGTAFAISAAANLLVFENYDVQFLVLVWAGVSAVMIIALSILSFIAHKAILAKIDVDKEVIHQNNIAIGAVQCIIYISLGLLLAELLA